MDVEIADDLFHAMCLLASLGSLEKTYHVTGANRSTLTHQSGLLREGFPSTAGLLVRLEIVSR